MKIREENGENPQLKSY